MQTESILSTGKVVARHDEAQRLAALANTRLLDSLPEDTFDRLTRFTASVLRVPVALISLVDRDRQFFKSQCGLTAPWSETRETPLSHSFCKHVVQTSEPLVVRDARMDTSFSANPAVSELGVVAYAGVPLVDTQGCALGSLCAIDRQPRDWAAEELELLRGVAAQVMVEIELRSKAHQLGSDLDKVREIESARQSMTRLTVHDLRTPLTGMLLGLEMLPVLGSLNASQQECLSLCLGSGEMLKGIVNDLLDIEAVGARGAAALTYEACDPVSMATQALDRVKNLATAKAIRLESEIPARLPWFKGDAHKLVRVLVNLLGNAIKFTPRNGCVRLGASVVAESATPYVKFAVSDTGVGIHSSATTRIFDEGFRLNPDARTTESMGLGLTFCKRIVEAHGGSIAVQSVPGKGSTFTVTVPQLPLSA